MYLPQVETKRARGQNNNGSIWMKIGVSKSPIRETQNLKWLTIEKNSKWYIQLSNDWTVYVHLSNRWTVHVQLSDNWTVDVQLSDNWTIHV